MAASPRNQECRGKIDAAITKLKDAKRDLNDSLTWEVNQLILKGHIAAAEEILKLLKNY